MVIDVYYASENLNDISTCFYSFARPWSALFFSSFISSFVLLMLVVHRLS